MSETRRSPAWGRRFAVASTHYLATQAGIRMLEKGGNAIDAGVATGLCINVLEPQLANFGGVAPIIVWIAKERRPYVISGLGRWPRRASLQYFHDHHGGDMPEGILRSVTPAAPDGWLTALERFGRLTLADVMAPAVELAENGFPMYPTLADTIARNEAMVRRFPENIAHYLVGDAAPMVGSTFRQPALAQTFLRLIEVEANSRARGRSAAIRAARDEFYHGAIARRVAEFSQDQGGWLDAEDLASFSVGVEAPVTSTYRDIDVSVCGPWCQGMVNLQMLNLVEGFDLKSMGHNSADYLHTIAEALKLSFADRDRYYVDPDFAEVPVAGLVSKAYASERRQQIRPKLAWPEMPPAGDPWSHQSTGGGRYAPEGKPTPVLIEPHLDTSYCCAMDADGNGFSATPSDAGFWSPTIPDLGFMISARGTQNWLNPAHPARVEPGKRPRLTPNPALATKNGELWLTWGCPGGDGQTQAMTQTLLNIVEWGMDPQAAIEAARVISHSFPDSFWPHAYNPGRLDVESRVEAAVRDELAARGHLVNVTAEYSRAACSVCAIERDAATGGLVAGADVRRGACLALAW